jgi:hypothetical protein
MGPARPLLFGLLLGLVVGIVLYAQDSLEDGELLFEEICLGCHTEDMFVGDVRSYKGWELTVYRMQNYAPFSDEEAELITEYLVALEGRAELPEEEPEVVEEPEANTTAVADASNQPAGNAPGAVAARTGGPQFVDDMPEVNPPGYLFTRVWNPSPGMVAFSRWLGYLAAACLLVLAATGASRRVLKRRFRPIHRGAGLGLLVVVGLHAVIYFFEYGAPPVAWLWYGIIATLLVAGAFITGFWRKQLKLNYRAVHYGLGGFAAGLAGLHWIWAWI